MTTTNSKITPEKIGSDKTSAESRSQKPSLYLIDFRGTMISTENYLDAIHNALLHSLVDYYVHEKNMSTVDSAMRLEHARMIYALGRTESQDLIVDNKIYRGFIDDVLPYAAQHGEFAIKIDDDVFSTLQKIVASNGKIIFASNAPRKRLEAILASAKDENGKSLGEYVLLPKTDVSSEKKGSSATFLALCDEYGFLPADSRAVDDEATPAKAAVQAGIGKVFKKGTEGINPEDISPEGMHKDGYFVINRFSEILDNPNQKQKYKNEQLQK